MTPEVYAARQAVIAAALAAYVAQFAKLFQAPTLGATQWLQMLQLLFPEVARQRRNSAELARMFYDAQRAENGYTRHDVLLDDYTFESFVRSMEPARRAMSIESAPENAVGAVARSAVREAENGGRRQIIRAVETDRTPKIVKGWARVATGRETCAWCLMLVSRGPVYMGADTAGLDLDDTSAQQMIAAGEDISEHMDEWHPGCDCKVVPVFNKARWPGKEAADRALELWIEADKEAAKEWAEMSDSDKAATTYNNRVINALRRRIYRGEIDPSEWSGIAIAA